MSEKNIDKSATLIEAGFWVLNIDNPTSKNRVVTRDIDSTYIQFHFCLKGGGAFHFNEGSYTYPFAEERSLLLYNPERSLNLNIDVSPGAWIVSTLISIEKFHALFSEEAGYIDFLTEENRHKKYYKEDHISPAMAVTLSQLFNYKGHESVRHIYLKAKAYELIALYFSRSDDADMEQCPFLSDEENVRKIRQAKEIVISRMADPPGLEELSEEIGLSLKKLKTGFKQLYGDTVFGFLLDYKMEYARKLLESGSYNVAEAGHKIGYSTSSHFIAAFRKKFGITPKKYQLVR